jgi:hypothetical protein
VYEMAYYAMCGQHYLQLAMEASDPEVKAAYEVIADEMSLEVTNADPNSKVAVVYPSGDLCFPPRLLSESGDPARERVALDCGAGFSARSTSFVLEGRDCAPRFRFAPNDVRMLASSLRPSMLISGGPSVMPAQ